LHSILNDSESNELRLYVENAMKRITWKQTITESNCLLCVGLLESPVQTSCNHRFCESCLTNYLLESRECPICRSTIAESDLQRKEEANEVSENVTEDGTEIIPVVGVTDAIPVSSKIKALVQDLLAPENLISKAVVFSQWTAMLDLIEVPLKENNISFVRFDGSLSKVKRDAAVKAFQTSDVVRVFLISLKAGGVGLNLTAASRVYMMDPWW
jgi:SNF2 family DNA or RNA helicase